ncbi:MAG: Gfo/Idh/MocA family oxidoreductase [Cytophagales bacterium]|nr:Gfo/Idh/MocA family oxidoreductase [Armatimonadota bacterium]
METERPVRWGVLGCARVFERRMVPAFSAAAGSTLAAIASRSLEKAALMATRHGIPHAYGSYEALLEDPRIDAVYIPLPNDLHREWTLRALAAGKHVLCDKPAALSYADAAQMANAARQAGLRLQEGFMYRHHPQHLRLRERIACGEIGAPVHIHGACSYLADRSNYDNIRWNPAQGGGALLDVGVYPVNAARLYFGAEPVAVYAAAALDAQTGVDLRTSAILEFSGDRVASIVGGFDQAFQTRLEIIGTGGIAVTERAFQVGDSGVTLSVRIGDSPHTEPFPHCDQYARQVEHFTDCLRDQAKSLWPGEDGAAQARVVEALRRSASEKRRVRIEEIEIPALS